MTSPSHPREILGDEVTEYLNILGLSGVTTDHLNEVKRALIRYLKYVNYKLDKAKSIEYFKKIQAQFSISYYKKQMYQIKKLLSYFKMEWASEIKLPPDPHYLPKRISAEDISNTLEYFGGDINYKRFKALTLLGSTSGLRAEELYALTPDDIDLENRIIHVRHDPKNNHSTKTGKSRVSFFTPQAKDALEEYLNEYSNGSRLRTLFSKKTLEIAFKDAPIQVKDLRKAFSQEWTRRNGSSGVKKILMGHSLRNDVDLMHYNAQSPDDLKQIYDKVMGERLDLDK